MGLAFNTTLPEGLLPETDAEGMREFLATLIVPKVSNAFYIQTYVGAGTVCFLAFLMIVIVIRRLTKRSAWLLQYYTTPLGTFIIPNAVMALVIFLFIFSIVYTVYSFLVVAHFKHGRLQHNYLIFHQAPWSALWAAAWYCGLGAVSAFPDALRLHGNGGLQRLVLRPSVFNAALICGPVACYATLLIPACIGSRIYNSVIPRHAAWLVGASDPASNIAELAAEARGIWLEVTRAYYYDSIVFGVWCTWGFVLLFVFSTIATHTLLRVRAQVKLAQRKKKALDGISQSFYLFSSRPNYDHYSLQPRLVSQLSAARHVVSGEQLTTGNSSTLGLRFAINEEQQARIQHCPELRSEMKNAAAVLFPALKSQSSEKLTKIQAASRRSSALKLVYRNVLIQYAAIGLGTAAFSGVSLFISCTSYRSARANNIGIHQEAQLLVATWSSCIFGAFIVGAVVWRSFDPAFILGAEVEEEEATELPFTTALTQITQKLSGEIARSGQTRQQALNASGDTVVPTSSDDYSAQNAKNVSRPTSPVLEALYATPLPPTIPGRPYSAAGLGRSQYGAWRSGEARISPDDTP